MIISKAVKPVSRAKDALDVLLVSPIHALIGNSAMMAVMLAFPASRIPPFMDAINVQIANRAPWPSIAKNLA